MKLISIGEKEFYNYAINHPNGSFYQTPQWGKLKQTNGWKYYLLGYKENKKIICACMLLEKQTPIKRSIFYCPKGFLIDYNDFELLKQFTYDLKKFIIEKKGFMLKIDPNVVYQLRNKEGIPFGNKNDIVIDNLKKIGFHHFGFNNEFETMQPRFLCGINIENTTYDDLIKTFTKNTKKRLLELKNLAVQVKKADKSEYSIAVNILDETNHRKHLAGRPCEYYIKMKDLFKDQIDFYLCYIDKKIAINKYKELINIEQSNKEKILNKMKTSIVGKKLNNDMELCCRKISLLEKRIEEVESFKEDKTYIGSLLSIWMGDESITLLSGTVSKYKNFLPKYAFYDEHIKESLRQKKKYVNFFGISGIFDPKSENYGIYEIKKGFNPQVVELIGEFDLIINRFWYTLYNITFKIYKALKKKK
ncbi:MAG: peptidoglycan bridge formation glycyltransferase FemA/FemB family protein [bacterium]|nr:peptidoglycan bridge formation glycyltransferase FemA/FemB family protein [bacterium]